MQRAVVLGILLSFDAASVQGAGRARDGLQALYDFSSSSGAIVKDRSGAGEPLDLRITSTNSVRRDRGSLEVRGSTLIHSDKAASKIIDAVRQSGEITIEAWLRPASAGQNGPARIVTLSRDPGERNFTLGQDGGRFDVRFRTTRTGANGIPSLGSAAGSLSAERTHVVYTRDRAGQARIFINGRKSVEQTIAGETSNWDGSFRLALANELTGDRPWLGTFHLVAIYSRKLSSKEVEQNFNAGISEPPPVAVAEQNKPARQPKPTPQPKTVSPASDQAKHFEAQIAPLLGRHCLECHGPEKPKGRLNLSRKDAVFAGGKSGKAIVPGKSAESLLWQKVESDEMPEERPPLSRQEKRLLREWIDAGAIWSANATAPLAHLPHRGADGSSLRRLTVPEYIETVRSAVGVDVAKEAREILPRDLRADGFHNTAYNLNVDLGHVEAYARLAQIIVGRMDVPAFAAEYTQCQQLNDACLREVISRAGKWLLRGPLEEREVNAFLRVSRAVASEGGDFKQAVGLVLEAMLQSPRFIYRIEKSGEGKPRPVGGYELASRLSYTLWGAPPDRELMRAADAGELSDRRRVEAQVRRMLQDPRAVERSARFIYEWLNLERLDNLRPNPERFPEWERQLAGDMREETLAFFREIAWEQKRPLSELLNARITYATPRLAKFYGLPQKRAEAIGGRIPERRAERLEALYTFEEGSGDVVRDVSGAGEPLHLKIEDLSTVQWGKGRLIVNGPTLIASAGPARRLTDTVRKAKTMSLEAWITPADASQSGPARILSLSSGTGQRNFTLGQDGDKYEVRFRAAGTDANGLPGLRSPGGSAGTRLTHVVFTRNGAGKAKLYINGAEKAEGDAAGDLSNWDDGFRFALANETTKDRTWRGTLHFVAIYSRVLSPEEVRSNGQVLSRYELDPASGRGGLLTQGSALTVGGEEASMVARGLFVLQDFLSGKVEDPPPCVDTTPVPTKPGQSQRAITETRLANAACAGCHSKFEPFAFALEKFDGLGAYREKDRHGNTLRDDGEVLFPDQDKPVAFRSSAELMDLLAGSERVRKVITQKVTQFALGRPLTAKDAPVVDKVHAQAQKGGGTYASLITAILMSDLVQMTWTESKK